MKSEGGSLVMLSSRRMENSSSLESSRSSSGRVQKEKLVRKREKG